MAQAMNTRARAIAIAAAGAVALGGVQIAAPSGSVLAAGVTEAVAQETGPQIPASAVKFLGIYDGKDDAASRLGDFDITGKGGDIKGYYARITLDLANVNSGDTIKVFFGANENDYSGGAIAVGTINNNLSTSDTPDVVNIRNTVTAYRGAMTTHGVEIKGLAAADGISSGQMTINVPVTLVEEWWSGGDNSPAQTDKIQTVDRVNQPVKAWTETVSPSGTQKGPVMRDTQSRITYKQIIGAEASAYFGSHERTMTSVVDGNLVTLNVRGTTPNTTDGVFTTTAYPSNRSDATPWVLSESGVWQPRILNVFFPDGKTITDAQKNGVKISATPTEGGRMNIQITGIPQGARVTYTVDKAGFTDLADPALYATSYTDTKAGMAYTGQTNGPSATQVAGLVDADGNAVKANRVPTVEIRVNNRVTTPDTAVSVTSGKEQTFQLVLSNKGNTNLSRPNVTDPSGKVTTLTDVSIAPGQSKTVDVKYTPKAGETSATWIVQYSNAQPVDATAWIKTGPAAGDVTVNGDGTITIQGPNGPITLAPIDKVNEAKKEAEDAKREADKANDRATQLEKDLAAEKARNDADAQKIAKLESDLAQAKKDAADAAKRAEDAAKKAQSEVDALEKVVADLKANQAADREKIAGLEKQLQDAKDGLKRAQDAAKAAQDTANNAQNTANQALADLAKERKRVDDLTKDLATERARVDDLTKRADKAEKDLADARKRVDALEKENKAQQGQIDQARKDITALRTEADRLGKELEAATKRVTALEKENKEQAAAIDALKKQNADQQGQIDTLKKENTTQQKQIDTLRADLTKTEKRVSTLETQLRETQAELNAVSARLGVVEDRLNTGLGKCIDTLGGGLLAVVPIIAVLATAANHVQVPGVQEQLTQAQKQMGVYNPQLADFMQKNAGALVAGAGAIAVLGMLLAPNTCRDNTSVGGAIGENLSSGRVTEKATQTENAQAEDTAKKEAVAAK